jgi:hypothetical protein
MNFFWQIRRNAREIQHKKLIYNLLDVEYNIDNNNKSLTIAPSEGFWFLGLFQDTYYEEYNFQTLCFGHSRPPLKCSYEKKNTII